MRADLATPTRALVNGRIGLARFRVLGQCQFNAALRIKLNRVGRRHAQTAFPRGHGLDAFEHALGPFQHRIKPAAGRGDGGCVGGRGGRVHGGGEHQSGAKQQGKHTN